MVKLEKIHVLSNRESCKCNNTLIVTIGRGLEKEVGFDFEAWVICC